MKKGSVFILLTTAAWAAVCFFKVHLSLDPSGGDGYFYLKQTEWLADHFQFYHADYSFIFFPLALIYKLTGSSLLAFQLITTFSLFAIMAALGLLFYDQTSWIKNNTTRIIVVCLFTLVLGMQSSVLKLSFEFAKNGMAQALVLWGLVFYFRNNLKLSFLFLILAAFTHKLAALFLAFAFVFWFIEAIYKKGWLKDKKRLIGLSAFLFMVLSILGVVFPRFFKHFVNFTEHFSFEKSFFMQIENQLMSRLLMGLTFFWLLIGLIQFRKQKNSILLALILFSLIPFLPLFSGYNTEIKYRLFLLSFTFGAVIFSMSLPTIQNQFFKTALLVISLSLLSYEAAQYNGFPWIMNWSEKIKNLDQLEARVESGSEVVTQHGLQFYIDYKTKIRARSMVSASRKPKYQIAYTPEFYHLNDEISDEIRQIEVLSLGSSYALFEYDDFQNLMRQYPMLSDWRNQFQVRPDFVQDY